MKIVCCMVATMLVFAPIVKSQPKTGDLPSSPGELHAYWVQRQHYNKVTGFVLLGVGATLGVIGSAVNVSSGWGPENKNKGLWLTYLGVGTMLGSIPAFISAGNNKRKARLALKNESANNIFFNNNEQHYAALALAVRL